MPEPHDAQPILPDETSAPWSVSSGEKIELLPISLMEENPVLISDLRKLAHSLHLELGWHYPLDLSWIIRQLGPVNQKRIMDAGAGVGILQWYLASQGAEVISVDRDSRARLPLGLRAHFRVQGLRNSDLLSSRQVIQSYLTRKTNAPFYKQWALKAYYLARSIAYLSQHPDRAGQVLIYNQDLTQLVDIADNSLDAVVSVSALEHNAPEALEKVVKEILRVLKPGGVLLATLTAARDQDYWHAASSGMCYTADTLRQIFNLPTDVPTNYARYDELFAALRDCADLREHLASFYFKSDKNGMPWGKWNPQYQPVGVYKIKRA